MLTDRRQRVLAALIHEYVAHALPVASKALVEGYPLGVSSATVRNDLCALEERGYIQQPHTSAGRIPTDSGYRSFVDALLAQADLDEDPATAEAMRRMRESARELDELLDRTSAMLTEITACLSIVLPARAAALPLRSIGLSTLMQQPEFQNSIVLVPLLRMIEDDSLLGYINNTAGEDGPVVRIGHENRDESLGNVSVVATQFGRGSDAGIIAVIGPTRMDYERALRAVQAARHTLDEI
ncbi:MAG: DeoR family transcriptional regulator [Coriobacteriia bacterium]|nr:DeoR family transcriptional regulator [Coriobacteriia bacterium]